MRVYFGKTMEFLEANSHICKDQIIIALFTI